VVQQAQLDEARPRELRGGSEPAPFGVEAGLEMVDEAVHEGVEVGDGDRTLHSAGQRVGEAHLSAHGVENGVGLPFDLVAVLAQASARAASTLRNPGWP